jgi:hypothetical protein
MRTDPQIAVTKDHTTSDVAKKPTPWLSDYYLGATPQTPTNWTVREERTAKLHILERQFARADASLQRLAALSLTMAEQDAILAVRDELSEVRDRIIRRLLDS